jgi:predicted ABC-type transport system involved in lysophospholipase L1 biosynthesis ATPase subunit
MNPADPRPRNPLAVSAAVIEGGLASPVPLLRLEGIGRTFDCSLVVALQDIDLAIHSGEVIAVVGQSGSGKTSLINIMGGCESPTSGRVYWKGSPMQRFSAWAPIRGCEIGRVFQDFMLLPALTAIENVEMTMMATGLPAGERRRRAAGLLDEVGLSARLHHLPNALSGGERQRVAIARAIANQPKLLLADEPTGNLDTTNAATVLDLLFDVQHRHGMTFVVVTHDDSLAARCQRCIRMKDGRILDDSRVSWRDEAGLARQAAGGRPIG